MRKELQFIIGLHLAILLFLVYQTFDLMTLLHDTSFKYALLEMDVNPPDNLPKKPELIPKIIHQTYKNETIPDIWKEGQQRCIDLHPDYEYILWTDESARDFIEKEYNWFLKTWDNYKYPIERADAIRYFVLNHFGGIYIDLDDGCIRRLDPLLTVPAFVRKTIPTGISNDVMGSVPKHPFFIKVIENLERYNWNYFVPYITIMYSTGPLFLSVIWKQYIRWNNVPEYGTVRILQPDDYKKHATSFFAIAPGSSWHMNDANFIKSLADHIVLCVFLGFMVAGLIFFAEYQFYNWLINGSYKRKFAKFMQMFNKKRNIIKRNRKDSNLTPADQIELLNTKELMV